MLVWELICPISLRRVLRKLITEIQTMLPSFPRSFCKKGCLFLDPKHLFSLLLRPRRVGQGGNSLSLWSAAPFPWHRALVFSVHHQLKKLFFPAPTKSSCPCWTCCCGRWPNLQSQGYLRIVRRIDSLSPALHWVHKSSLWMCLRRP